MYCCAICGFKNEAIKKREKVESTVRAKGAFWVAPAALPQFITRDPCVQLRAVLRITGKKVTQLGSTDVTPSFV